MRRTTLSGWALALLVGLGVAWLTEGFEVWTAEGARRRTVAMVPVMAPAATLLGLGLEGQSLHGLLASPGRVSIVNFTYTRCAGGCMALRSSMQQLQEAVSAPRLHRADGSSIASANSANSAIKLLSISFDPAHDGIDQLERYATRWQADPAFWRLVTVPNLAELQRLLAAWQVVVIADQRGGFEHNAGLLVVDEQGRLVRIFDSTQHRAALDFARSLLRARHKGLML